MVNRSTWLALLQVTRRFQRRPQSSWRNKGCLQGWFVCSSCLYTSESVVSLNSSPSGVGAGVKDFPL